MQFIDFIKRRKNVVCQESEGFNLAMYSIHEFNDRKFTFKGFRNKYTGISADALLKQLQDEMNSMLVMYRYTTKIKKFTDRKGVPQINISLIAKASMMNRYNPLDTELKITTET